MAVRRIRLNSNTKSMTSASAQVQRLALFGPPLLLKGEDADMYNELLARMCAALKPVDIIDEMFVADMLNLQWEILRLRRLRLSLLTESEHGALKSALLSKKMGYELYQDIFKENLAQIIEKSLPKDQAQEPGTPSALSLTLTLSKRSVSFSRDR